MLHEPGGVSLFPHTNLDKHRDDGLLARACSQHSVSGGTIVGGTDPIHGVDLKHHIQTFFEPS